MSGGITNIYVEDILVINRETTTNVKKSTCRGGYVKGIFISSVTMNNVKCVIGFTGFYGDHPNDCYNPNALLVVDRIIFKDIVGENITILGDFNGIQKDPFNDICMLNIFFNVALEATWICSNVKGFSELVYPQACVDLQHRISNKSSFCSFSLVNNSFKGL